MRPEIIIPLEKKEEGKDTKAVEATGAMEIGSQLRIIRQPHFGEQAEVIELPVELTTLESETKVRVVTVKLVKTGETYTLPRANVEIIEG